MLKMKKLKIKNQELKIEIIKKIIKIIINKNTINHLKLNQEMA